jgi:hypothetical protein
MRVVYDFLSGTGLNAKAKFHYRSLSYALYRCRMSFTLLRPLPSRGVVLQLFVQTYHRLLPAFWHFYNQCLFNSFCQVIWLECESKVSYFIHLVCTTKALTLTYICVVHAPRSFVELTDSS